jgi:hypothetical protein
VSVEHNRASARTTDEAALQAKVDRIEGYLRRNRQARLERRVRSVNDGEAFAQAEQQLEDERFRNA